MKNYKSQAIFIFAILISSMSVAQNTALFFLKDGSTKQAEIIGHSKDAVFVQGGSIKLLDILRVELSSEMNKDYFIKSRVSVLVNSNIVPTSPIETKSKETNNTDLTSLYNGIERFRVQRTAAKGLEFLGVVAIGASIIVATQEEPNPDLVKVLAIGGTVVAGIGFAIDIEAGKHLRFKH